MVSREGQILVEERRQLQRDLGHCPKRFTIYSSMYRVKTRLEDLVAPSDVFKLRLLAVLHYIVEFENTVCVSFFLHFHMHSPEHSLHSQAKKKVHTLSVLFTFSSSM